MHHDEDAAIMVEMGANAVRLAHYPQATYFYDLMDKYGIVTWLKFLRSGRGDIRIELYQPAFFSWERERAVERIDPPAL